jgi:hypothetical protein
VAGDRSWDAGTHWKRGSRAMLGPCRSWSSPSDGLSAVPFLHRVKGALIEGRRLRKDDGRDRNKTTA